MLNLGKKDIGPTLKYPKDTRFEPDLIEEDLVEEIL